jgi:hypothetical protein
MVSLTGWIAPKAGDDVVQRTRCVHARSSWHVFSHISGQHHNKVIFSGPLLSPIDPWVPEIARAERLDPIEGRDERYWSWLSPVK